MDVIVTVGPDGKEWTLTDLLDRDMGRIKKGRGTFKIEPAGYAVKTTAALASHSYSSLDLALAAIEEYTRGVCRHARPSATRAATDNAMPSPTYTS